MDEITAVGKVLKRLRKQKGLSQFDLGMLMSRVEKIAKNVSRFC